MAKRTFSKVPITIWRKILARAAEIGYQKTSLELGMTQTWISNMLARGATSSKPPGARPSTLSKLHQWYDGTNGVSVNSHARENHNQPDYENVIRALLAYKRLTPEEKKAFLQLEPLTE